MQRGFVVVVVVVVWFRAFRTSVVRFGPDWCVDLVRTVPVRFRRVWVRVSLEWAAGF